MDFVTQLIGHIYEALFCHYHYELVSSPSASGLTKHSITITNSNGEVTSLLFFARDVRSFCAPFLSLYPTFTLHCQEDLKVFTLTTVLFCL